MGRALESKTLANMNPKKAGTTRLVLVRHANIVLLNVYPHTIEQGEENNNAIPDPPRYKPAPPTPPHHEISPLTFPVTSWAFNIAMSLID